MWPQSRDLKHLCNSAATLFCTMSKSLCFVHASKISLRWLDDDMHEMIDLGNFEIIQWLHFASPFMWILYLFLRNKTQTVLFLKIIFSKMKLSLFIAGVAFAAPNNVQNCMKYVVGHDGPVMERAMGAAACLERSDAYIQPGQCWVQFLKVIFPGFGEPWIKAPDGPRP